MCLSAYCLRRITISMVNCSWTHSATSGATCMKWWCKLVSISRISGDFMWEGIRGSTSKGVPEVRYNDAGWSNPTPKYRTDWNVFRNLRLTLRALAALVGSSQGLQLTRVLTFQSCLDSSQSRCGHEDYKPSDCQTANGARLQIEYYVHTRIPGPYININAPQTF